MRRKLPIAPAPTRDRPDELRHELERLGLAPADAGELASRLEGLSGELPVREVLALLDGAGRDGHTAASPAPKAPELHRILEDFASELKKLDEGLRVLMAFLIRLRDHAAVASPKTLH